MNAVIITRRGGYEVVRAGDWPDPPPPGRGEVRVAVRAAGTNFADTLARVGVYPDAPKLPAVLGFEVAGVVESVGPDVSGPAVGDRVIAGCRFGGQAELVVARAADCVPLPDHMSFAQGAAVLVNYGTAWAAAIIMAGLRAGETVLVHIAAGATGMAATQIATAVGADVIGTASESKHAAVLANGATHVIDRHRDDFAAEVLRITEGRGVDVILDPLGPASFRRDWTILRPGGRLVLYGMSDVQRGERRSMRRVLTGIARLPFSNMPWWKGSAIFDENKGVFALNMLRWWDRERDLGRILEPVGEGLAKGTFSPVVAAAFPFSRAADAHRYMQEARNVGKVVLVPD